MDRERDYREDGIEYLYSHRNHFWFSHRNRIILESIVKCCKKPKEEMHILELGAGSGNICRFLKRAGYKVDASDLYRCALKYFENETDKAFTFNVISNKIPHELKGKYNIVILGDVIEHLHKPTFVMKRMSDFLDTAGCILITVPALMQLWSPYDSFSGHKKRYSRRALKNELMRSQYCVEEIRYFMLLPAIILLFQRTFKSILKRSKESFSDELNINRFANRIMEFMMTIEYKFGKIIDYPFGSSLIAIGRKI